MPSTKVLERKQQFVDELSTKLSASIAGVIVDYKGINVEKDTKLRSDLRQAGIDYFVVKNTLLKLAAAKANVDIPEDVLNGTTALAISNDDYVAAARILCKFAETNKDLTFSVKSGFLDGVAIDVKKVESLAKLPSRDVLLATVLGAFNAPIAAFARAIQAIADKNGEPAAAAE